MIEMLTASKGNSIISDDWTDGTELIAFDSLIYNASGFNDYNGNAISVGNFSTGTAKPSISDKTIFNGTGILYPYACYTARVGMSVSSWLNTGWTLDYWTAQSASTTSMQLSCCPLAVYPTVAYNTASNRFLIAEQSAVLYQWNNAASGTSWGTTYSDLLSTGYSHLAITYDGTQFRVFTNGVLRQTIAKTAFALPTPTTSQVVGPVGQGGYQPVKFSIIDRYRLRQGVIWTTNFDTGSIYPT